MLSPGVGEPRGGDMRGAAHVIVCGNEKGGSGKSTTAMHIAVSLLKSGHRVATVDLDGRQLSLTRYVENRRRWADQMDVDLAVPRHFHVPPARRETVAAAESEELRQLIDGLMRIEDDYDFVVIDTPGANTFLGRLAHLMADTLVTPMNDSFIDLDVLASVDPISHEILGFSPYAQSVLDARRERRQTDDANLDWVVLRNRMAVLTSRNEQKVDACLRRLASMLGFRLADGIAERVVFREFFPIGLTALDDFEQHVLAARPTLSHLAARQEIRQLMTTLRLPLAAPTSARSARKESLAEADERTSALPDIFAD